MQLHLCRTSIKRFLYFLRFDIADIITSLTIVCKPLSESCLIACYIPGSIIRSEGMSSSFDTTSSTFSYENDEERQDNCYYSYDHASVRHVLMKQKHGAAASVKAPPKYSLRCICCNLVDIVIFAGCIAFLYFAITYAFSLLDDYGDGGD